MTILNSKVTWVFVGTFILGGLNAIVPVVSPMIGALITGIISVLGIYLHNGQIVAGSIRG